MTVDEVIAAYRALPLEERRQVFQAMLLENDLWIPESYRQGMEDAPQEGSVDPGMAITQKLPEVNSLLCKEKMQSS